MTDKQRITQGEMKDLEKALNDFLLEAPQGLGGITSLLNKDEEVKSMIFGSDESIELLLITLLQYAAEKQEVNVFEKILNIQMRLMQLLPEDYQEYADMLNKLNEDGAFT